MQSLRNLALAGAAALALAPAAVRGAAHRARVNPALTNFNGRLKKILQAAAAASASTT